MIESFINSTKKPLPEDFAYEEARRLLGSPNVTLSKDVQIHWDKPIQEENLLRFLVEEKGFSRARVESGLATLKKARMSMKHPLPDKSPNKKAKRKR